MINKNYTETPFTDNYSIQLNDAKIQHIYNLLKYSLF